MSHHVRITIEHDGWRKKSPDSERIARRAVLAALAERAPKGGEAEVSLLLTGDAEVARLNGQYRNREGATNVLSFANGFDGIGGERPVLLGDIVLAYETVAAEAPADDKRFEDHLAHLVVHGVLHLLGFDHEADGPAARMEEAEISILNVLGVPDPYGPGAASTAHNE